jgi:hypothetical protein
MKNTTLKTFVENSNIPARLVRAVIRQMGGFEAFKQSAPEISQHGIDGGFNGFIYNHETEAFARRNRADIAKIASQQADDFGSGVFEMIRAFFCFKGDKLTDDEIGQALYAGKQGEDAPNILNGLAWYAGEEVSRAYCDMTEQN